MPTPPEVPLSWSRLDVEQRLGFRGGRYTQVNNLLSALIAAVLTVAFYGALWPVRTSVFARMFTERGPTPYAIAFLSFWALAILVLKARKLKLQRRALDFVVVPQNYDFVLSPATADVVVDQIYATVDDPRHFVLFNRIVIALSNLRNLGRVADVDDILRSQAEHDDSSTETSYAVVRGFVWAIPVLGFIGTVLGLSEAIGAFGSVLQSSEEFGEIKSALQGVTGGLATAFETTLEALVAALFIQLYLTFIKKSEEEFLDACSEYCVRHVVNRLRLSVHSEAAAAETA
ncbi:MAG TPA: MotA/TolQ/ExbB proton channel family protein [Planctomycetaceae bacterium]|nr:MotA/TolQ/ExbB proton channel family protein [Planctomycetaceae bacterium]